MTDFGTSGASATAPGFVAYTSMPPAEQFLEQHLGESAQFKLPASYQESFVKFLPWLVLIFLPFHIIGVVALLGVSAIATLFGSFAIVGALLSVAILICDIIALPGLFKRTRTGWSFLVYAQVLGVVGNLLNFSIFGLLVSVVLFWLAFQVKYKYS